MLQYQQCAVPLLHKCRTQFCAGLSASVVASASTLRVIDLVVLLMQHCSTVSTAGNSMPVSLVLHQKKCQQYCCSGTRLYYLGLLRWWNGWRLETKSKAHL